MASLDSSSMTADEHYEIGFSHRCSGDYAAARRELDKVLAIEPGHARARWQMALIKGFEGDFEGSMEGLKEAVAMDPANTDIRYDYGMTLMMLGYMDEACGEFHQVLTLDPDHEKARQQIIYCP